MHGNVTVKIATVYNQHMQVKPILKFVMSYLCHYGKNPWENQIKTKKIILSHCFRLLSLSLLSVDYGEDSATCRTLMEENVHFTGAGI